jgi:hypothetical protein
MQATSKTAPEWGIFQRCALLLAVFLAAGKLVSTAALPPPACVSGHYSEVTVNPADASIYVGKVSLAMSPLTRRGNVYTSDYSVKVFPFFFFNERGRISIEVSAEQLQQLARGETVDLKGHASNSRGAERRIEGRAVSDAAGGDHGKIKVRVWVSKNIELAFNTAYRFTGKE